MWLPKGNIKDACGDRNAQYLDCTKDNILTVIL